MGIKIKNVRKLSRQHTVHESRDSPPSNIADRCQVETPTSHLEEAMAMMTIDSEVRDKISQPSKLHQRRRKKSRKMLLNSRLMICQLPASKHSLLLNIAVSHQVASPTSVSAEQL